MLCKILRLFVNTLTANDKYSHLNRDNLRQASQILLSKKQKPFTPFCSAFLKNMLLKYYYLRKKTFYSIFLCIFQKHIKFWTFLKTIWPSYPMHFRNYGFPKTWLDKCIKSPNSEATSTSNMGNGSNNSCNWRTAPLPYLLIIMTVIELKKYSFDALPQL